MATDYDIPVFSDGWSASVHIEPSLQGARAYSLLFDADANVRAILNAQNARESAKR